MRVLFNERNKHTHTAIYKNYWYAFWLVIDIKKRYDRDGWLLFDPMKIEIPLWRDSRYV